MGFETNGKITKINKHVGDPVAPGEILAQVDSASLRMDLQKAQNSLRQAELTYQKNINPLSEQEKQQLNADLDLNTLTYEQQLTKLANDQVSYEQSISAAKNKISQIQQDIDNLSGDNSLALKQQVEDQNFLQKQKELYGTFFDVVSKLREFEEKVDQFMGFSAINALANDSYENNISALNTSYRQQAQTTRQQLHYTITSFKNPVYQDYPNLVQDASKIQNLLEAGKQLSVSMQDVIGASVVGNGLTQTQLDSRKSSFLSYGNSVSSFDKSISSALESLKKSQISSTSTLESTANSLRDKRVALEQQLATAQQDLLFTQQKYDLNTKTLEQTRQYNDKNLAKAFLDNQIKLNPLSSQEKALFDAQVASARLAVTEKQQALAKASLVSPVSGVVLTIAGNVGEQSSSQFMTIGTNGYRYVKVSIDEDEIDKIKQGQSVRIKADAVSDLSITGTVYYVANAGNADNNGVVSFDVFVSFYTDDIRLRTAMNVEVSFLQKSVENVLTLPVKAVYPYNNVPTVTMSDGSRRPVITGLSDGKMVEVIS